MNDSNRDKRFKCSGRGLTGRLFHYFEIKRTLKACNLTDDQSYSKHSNSTLVVVHVPVLKWGTLHL